MVTPLPCAGNASESTMVALRILASVPVSSVMDNVSATVILFLPWYMAMGMNPHALDALLRVKS